MSSQLKDQITDDMKTAMRAKDSARLLAIRLLLAAIKQREIDERIELDDDQVLVIITKMVKQRRDSIKQFTEAARQDLVDQEAFEIGVIETYLPPQLGEQEVTQLIEQSIKNTGAASMQDMGKVMGDLRPKIQGRADMGAVSVKIKALLNS